ncbi:MAG: molybdopterin cofactor-binding domain-containing protein [Geminicoccaceae bacterium]
MPPSTTFARQFGAQFSEVEVDIETVQIKIINSLAVQDSGTVVNPHRLSPTSARCHRPSTMPSVYG